MAGFAIAPLLLGSAAFSAGSGLFVTLLPLRLSQLGFTAEAIGIVVTASMAGFILGCLLTAPMIRAVGHVRTFAAFAAVAAVATLAFEWADSLWICIALRAVSGFSVAALAVVTESWLNALSSNENRGRVLTFYVLTLGLFYGLGQLAASDFEAGGHRLLIVTAALYAAALVPLTAVKVESPPPPTRFALHLLAAFKVSPTGAIGAVATGLIASTFTAVGVLLGRHYDFDQSTIVYLMAASQIGGIALQYPLGWASDRVDRRYVLLFMHAALIVVALGFVFSSALSPLWLFVALFVGYGGFAEALYPVSVAQANDRAKPEDYVGVSSNLLLLWALGGAIGPLAGTPLLESGGATAFFWYVAGVSLVLGLFTLWRVLAKRRLEDDTTLEEFVVYPTTSPAVYEWVPHKAISSDSRKAPPEPDQGDS